MSYADHLQDTLDAPEPADRTPDGLPLVVTKLFKGVVYRDADEKLWQRLMERSAQARDYVAVLGLELVLDDAEGFAFLRSSPDADPELPRLIPRRQLTFHVSLLLALLRARLAEFDQQNSETRLIMTAAQIGDMVSVFLPESSNEARILDQLAGNIKKVVELGFLRKLRGQEGSYEVARILKAYVDAQWLEEFDARLADYRAELEGRPGNKGGPSAVGHGQKSEEAATA
ncbi:hypothetical protein JOF48_001840 [Arthrobacter stackebrandtii]|uniref:DUF4194 domain-containing protein n=1 Tax=Arthrobacter stackebrandtii TaxID=272161 RepID=A0ABS4YW77_9MICC|nr:DUF4194 domain-containing protein [Arthrobacter stackebrandtii]MBP2413041.1 hypothetical protein [Arthrobacter stackebrandtii]PYH01180.1 hypothetical protein CVV67_06225 [Arthrobacter stackebrandtii]